MEKLISKKLCAADDCVCKQICFSLEDKTVSKIMVEVQGELLCLFSSVIYLSCQVAV